MKIRFSIAALLYLYFALFCSGCNAEKPPNWAGDYFYEHALGEGAGGIARFTEYLLTIGPAAECKLDVQGFQSNQNIVCSASKADTTLTVQFLSYKNGSTSNAVGVRVYKKDETLFSLRKNGEDIVTHWHSMQPDGLKLKEGVFFIQELE